MSKNIHYIFGLKKNFGNKPWCYFHHLSVKSAKIINPNYKINFWYQYEPSGFWWNKSKEYIDIFHCIQLPDILDNTAKHYAHVADIQRLVILKQHGGIYIDSDVICLKPFSDLDLAKFWMGRQARDGLCNATIGGEANSEFLNIWLDSSKSFNPNYWDEFAVKRPYELSKIHSNLIKIYPENYFFTPSWREQRKIVDLFQGKNNGYLSRSYSVHLWESINYNFLKKITPDNISRESELGILCRNLIWDFNDDQILVNAITIKANPAPTKY